jgi:adenine phosphoribosyltransferase
MSTRLLKKTLQQAPIIKKGTYYYVIHPITDGIPEIHPDLLKEVTDELVKHLTAIQPFDKIVTMEAMGIPLATILSLTLHVPFSIIRKRCYELPDEYSVTQITGYSTSSLYINGIKPGDSVVIVDDVLSTGGTLRAVLSSLQQIGVMVKGVYIAVDKGTTAEKISKEFHVPIHSLVHIRVDDGRIVFEHG